MTKSELIERLVEQNPTISIRNVESGVKSIIDLLSRALEQGERIEIRGFGSFSLHYRQQCVGRNPKTGEKVDLAPKYVPHFKAGKELKERVDQTK